jgi:hypothetical protein
MENREQLVEALSALVRAPELFMSHVFIDHRKHQYTVRGQDGHTLLVIKAEELCEGGSLQEKIEHYLSAMICMNCHTVLLAGESGACGPCEAKAVVELLRMQQSFGTEVE